MPRSHCKNISRIWKIKTVSSLQNLPAMLKCLPRKNYLNEPHDTKFQRTIVNNIKEWQEFTKKQLNEIEEKELKEDENLQEAHVSTNRKLIEMMKTSKDLRMESKKKIETLKRTQDERNMDLKGLVN